MLSKLRLRPLLDLFGRVFLALIFLRVLSGPTADVAYLLLVVYALAGRAQAIEALFLSFLFNNLNVMIFSAVSTADVARYLVVAAAAFSVFARSSLLSRGRIDPVTLTVFALTAYFIFHSAFFSAVAIISLLKSAIWGLALITLLQGWRDLDLITANRVETRIFVVLAVCVILSVFLVFLPAAYVPRTTYLQGVFGHSQALGIVAAIVSVFALMRALAKAQPSMSDLGLFAFSSIALFETNSRTAMIAALLAAVIVVGLAVLRKSGPRAWSLPGLKSSRFFGLSLLAVLAAVSMFGAIQDTFIKRSDLSVEEADLVDLYGDSRGGLAEKMWVNIEADPLFGIGFGLASDLDEMKITYFQGIPVGAVVEKGITILAVWEEVGLAGLLLFCVLLFQIAGRSLALGPERIAVFLVIILLNFGEATLLSAGGAGLIQLVLFGWLIAGRRKAAVPQPELANQAV